MHFLDICRAVEHLPPPRDGPDGKSLLLDGLARMHTRGRAVAIPILQRAAIALAQLPDADVLRWGWIAPMASHVTWDSAAASEIYERQAEIVRAAGALAELPVYASSLALDYAWNGDLAGARVLIAESDAVAAVTGSRLPPFAALRLRALEGREAEASALIAATIEQATAQGQGLAVRVAQWATAVLYNGIARYDEAAAAAREITANDLDPYPQMWALPELVEAAARLGENEVARQALDRLTEMTRPAATGWALGTQARSRALLSECENADLLYREAIERFGATKLLPETAHAHLVYGEWLRREGRRYDAREQLRAAHQMFVGMGIEGFAERTRRELVAMGEAVRKHSVETRDELTPHEEQIARLARDGLSNPAIGAQLFLSARTGMAPPQRSTRSSESPLVEGCGQCGRGQQTPSRTRPGAPRERDRRGIPLHASASEAVIDRQKVGQSQQGAARVHRYLARVSTRVRAGETRGWGAPWWQWQTAIVPSRRPCCASVRSTPGIAS
jgi:hypothetical protein